MEKNEIVGNDEGHPFIAGATALSLLQFAQSVLHKHSIPGDELGVARDAVFLATQTMLAGRKLADVCLENAGPSTGNG